ncbi:MAG: methionine gamma-lyase family protein [Clostridia bacterium]
MSIISNETREFGRQVHKKIQPYFEKVDEIVDINTEKVLSAYRKHRVSEVMLGMTTGYGYDDVGRDTLDKIYADIFGTESALVRIQFVNGTHAIAAAMFACVKSGDTLLSITGAPYDTLLNTVKGDFHGSFKSYGINYKQLEFSDSFDLDLIKQTILEDDSIKTIFIQRSKGYAQRITLPVEKIGEICAFVKSIKPELIVLVDNCYGEFVEKIEPTNVGADLVCGSLIKNIGGGIAPTGGYIAGRSDLIENASFRLTAPGIGGECGSTLGNNRALYQGLFLASHVVGQAIKTAIFTAQAMLDLGYDVKPQPDEMRHDIIQTVDFGTPDPLLRFCEGIQSGSPIDSHVTPYPWDMPGYQDQVVMAAGAFIQGSSIELSADAPMREPYTCFVQGGLTYESGKTGVLIAVDKILNRNI